MVKHILILLAGTEVGVKQKLHSQLYGINTHLAVLWAIHIVLDEGKA